MFYVLKKVSSSFCNYCTWYLHSSCLLERTIVHIHELGQGNKGNWESIWNQIWPVTYTCKVSYSSASCSSDSKNNKSMHSRVLVWLNRVLIMLFLYSCIIIEEYSNDCYTDRPHLRGKDQLLVIFNEILISLLLYLINS